MSSDAPPLAPGALGGAADGVLPITDTPPAPSPTSSAGHPHLDNEPDALGSHHGGVGPSHDSGRLFIGTLHHDVFHGTRGPDLFDFVTVPNSLQSGDSIDGRGGLDALTAAFNAPFAIDHTLAVTNVPLVEITLPGGTNSLDAGGVSGVDTLTLHGPGDISLTGGAGIAALVVTDAGHHDTLGGFSQITYENLGDPAGLHLNNVDLIDVPAGGTHIDFLNHSNDTLTLHGTGDVYVTVSGAAQIIGAPGPGGVGVGVGIDYHVTVTGMPPPTLNVALNSFEASLVFDTTGPVIASISGEGTVIGSNFDDALTLGSNLVVEGGAGNNTLTGSGSSSGNMLSYRDAPSGIVADFHDHLPIANGYDGFDVVSGFYGISGSEFNDVITTSDTTQWVFGGGGVDTVHLGGSSSNFAYLADIATVDVAVPLAPTSITNVVVIDLAETSTFDLRGGGHSELIFGMPAATLDFSNTGSPGSIGLHGVDTVTLPDQAAATFDGTVLNGGTMTIDMPLGTVQLDTSRETGSFDVVLGQDVSGAVIGTPSDKLDFTTGAVELDHFAGSALSGVIRDLADPQRGPEIQFTDFGALVGNSYAYQAACLQIANASGVSTVDLQTSDISGTGGTAMIGHFGSVTNLTDTPLNIVGDSGPDTLVAGNGGDTLTGGGFLDRLIGGTGADHFVYLAASDSTPNSMDIIENFHDSGTNTSVLDVAGVSTVTQHFTGDKGTLATFPNLAAMFAGDHAGDVDFYSEIASNGNSGTFVHVASGNGYSSSDLFISLSGAHVLTAANFHLHP